MIKQIVKEFNPRECVVCNNPMQSKDAIGFPWCAEHEHHGRVLSWGYRHGFPELHFDSYAISAGEHSWWIAVTLSANNSVNQGNEGFMWIALIYIEYLDSQGKASSSLH
jgi:hypothetical protein